MKESDALKKWCPHARMVFGYKEGTTQPFNRFMCEDTEQVKKMQDAMNDTSGTKCVGSNCMMWDPQLSVEEKEQDSMPEGDGWRLMSVNLWRRWEHKGDGDCGLKPVCNGCSYPG